MSCMCHAWLSKPVHSVAPLQTFSINCAVAMAAGGCLQRAKVIVKMQQVKPLAAFRQQSVGGVAGGQIHILGMH